MKTKTYELSPLDPHWGMRIAEIKDYPIKTLLRYYKRYYKVVPINFTRETVAEKVAYYYQWLVYKYRDLALSPRLLERTLRVINKDPDDIDEFTKSYGPLNKEESMAKKKVAGKKGEETKVAPKKVTKKKGLSIASIVYSLIEAGKSDANIIKAVQKKFPESKINKAHMAWYRRQAKIKSGEIVVAPKTDKKKKKSSIKDKVPPSKKKKGSKKKKKDEDEDLEEEEEEDDLDEDEEEDEEDDEEDDDEEDEEDEEEDDEDDEEEEEDDDEEDDEEDEDDEDDK